MSMVTVPASADDAFGMLESAMGFLAGVDAAGLPDEALGRYLQRLERVDAIEAAARSKLLEAFDAKDGHRSDGQRTLRAWAVHVLRVTRGQAAGYRAVQALAREHPVLLAALAEGDVVTASEALQLARWTRPIPDEYRGPAEEIVVAAARSGADLRSLAAIIAEIRCRTAPEPDDGTDPDRGLSLDTTLDGAGLLRGELTPACAAMVRAVLDALSAPQGSDDLRTRPERYHDALEEAMKRLLASGLLPQRAGQPVKALAHIHVSELLDLDQDSVLQDKWIEDYRARWAAARAAASVSPGDGGAWLEGNAARRVACDAMIVPVVSGDIDPAAVEELIAVCVEYHRVRAQAAAREPASGGQQNLSAAEGTPGTGPVPDGTDTGSSPGAPDAAVGPDGDGTAGVADVLAMLEHQILAKVIAVVSGPGGVASFLRRNLLGKPLGGPSLPLDVGRTDDIPVHLRRLVALRDQTCGFAGGCDQPASGCEPHHVVHRKDGGHTSLAGLKNYCDWHHNALLHRMGWQLIVHPDATSQVRSPRGKIIRSHSPPPRHG